MTVNIKWPDEKAMEQRKNSRLRYLQRLRSQGVPEKILTPVRALGEAARKQTLPASLQNAADARALHRRLTELCDELDRRLVRPIDISIQGQVRTVVVFGCVAYRIDATKRLVTSGRMRVDGTYEPVPDPVELYRPLTSDIWLRWLTEDLSLSEYALQKQLFITDEEARELDDWVVQRAYAILKRNSRFQLLQSSWLPRDLALDRTLIPIAVTARPPRIRWILSTLDYSMVWRHERKFRQVTRENPKLLPLLAICRRENRIPLFLDPVEELRDLFLSHGLSRAAWRYVTRHGTKLFRLPWALSKNRSFLQVAIEYLRELDAAGLPPLPPSSVVEEWLRSNVGNGELINFSGKWNGVPTDILAIAFRQADKLRHSSDLGKFVEEFNSVAHWAIQTVPALDKPQRHAGWTWLVRQSRHWWETELLLEKTEHFVWRSRVPAFCHGQWLVRPLESTRALVEEAAAMRHCVNNYDGDCAEGTTRIFSVKDIETGRRRATIGIHREDIDEPWYLLDVKGFANSTVNPALVCLGKEIAEMYPDKPV